jgi:hypothetical protein
MHNTTKILDVIISTICLAWSAVTAWRLLRGNKANGLTMALAALFTTIGLACAWSVWFIWRIKTRYELLIVPHIFGMISLAIVLEWLNSEWEKNE